MFRSNFSSPDDLVLHSKQTHTNWGAILIVFITIAEKCFSQILTTFSSTKTTGAGKVVNRVRMTLFCTRKIPTLFGFQLLSFLVSTAKNFFGQILMTFPTPDTDEADKVENRVRMT